MHSATTRTRSDRLLPEARRDGSRRRRRAQGPARSTSAASQPHLDEALARCAASAAAAQRLVGGPRTGEASSSPLACAAARSQAYERGGQITATDRTPLTDERVANRRPLRPRARAQARGGRLRVRARGRACSLTACRFMNQLRSACASNPGASGGRSSGRLERRAEALRDEQSPAQPPRCICARSSRGTLPPHAPCPRRRPPRRARPRQARRRADVRRDRVSSSGNLHWRRAWGARKLAVRSPTAPRCAARPRSQLALAPDETGRRARRRRQTPTARRRRLPRGARRREPPARCRRSAGSRVRTRGVSESASARGRLARIGRDRETCALLSRAASARPAATTSRCVRVGSNASSSADILRRSLGPACLAACPRRFLTVRATHAAGVSACTPTRRRRNAASDVASSDAHVWRHPHRLQQRLKRGGATSA